MRRATDLTQAVTLAAIRFEEENESARGLVHGNAPQHLREKFIQECIDGFEAPRSVIEEII